MRICGGGLARRHLHALGMESAGTCDEICVTIDLACSLKFTSNILATNKILQRIFRAWFAVNSSRTWPIRLIAWSKLPKLKPIHD